MNRHKYAVSAMCRTLNISRSTYYYEAKERLSEAALEMAVIKNGHLKKIVRKRVAIPKRLKLYVKAFFSISYYSIVSSQYSSILLILILLKRFNSLIQVTYCHFYLQITLKKVVIYHGSQT